MSEEQVETVEQEAPEVQEAPEQDDRDWEGDAQEMGWHNPESPDFEGDPEKALSAKEFVERGEEKLPILRKNYRNLLERVKGIDEEREQFKSFMESQMAQQKKEYEARLEEAVQDGDIEKYRDLKKNEPDFEPEKPQTNQAVADFQARNDWYGTDDVKTAYAQYMDGQIAKEFPGISQNQHFELLEKAVNDKFKETPMKTTTRVQPSRKRITKGNSKTYEAMPKESQAACDKMVRNYGVKKDDFVANYWRENS